MSSEDIGIFFGKDGQISLAKNRKLGFFENIGKYSPRACNCAKLRLFAVPETKLNSFVFSSSQLWDSHGQYQRH